jgi:hypothetical protein
MIIRNQGSLGGVGGLDCMRKHMGAIADEMIASIKIASRGSSAAGEMIWPAAAM